jgi:hypothetical protein
MLLKAKTEAEKDVQDVLAVKIREPVPVRLTEAEGISATTPWSKDFSCQWPLKRLRSKLNLSPASRRIDTPDPRTLCRHI